MSFKDKPKREGGKPFDRDRKKPAAARKPDEGAFSPSERSGKPARKPAFDAGSAAGADKPERISKILARAGIASRRDVERMIMEGRVSVNGKVLETPVLNATMSDKIEVDGQPIRGIERTRLWLYHKPAGLVTTNSDPEGRPTVFDSLPEELPRVMSIGRLDINTEGLLLLTNDGGLSRVLELPTTGWLRRYRVRAYGEVSQEQLDKLKDGIAVDGVLYGAIDATLDRTQGHNVWITMGLREGKNREIKNVMGALGLEVNRLIRISYGPFQLGDLPEGHVVEARGRMLRDQLGPRLIEEAKANFDAPIYNNPPPEEDDPEAKSSRPEPRRTEKAWGAGEKNAGPRTERDAPRGERREGGKFGDRSNDRPQGRGDGKFAGKGKPAGKFGGKFEGKFDSQGGGRFDEEQPKKRPPMGTSRTANVWMAPGARPTKDGAGKPSARAEAERLFTKPTEAPRRPNVNRVQGDSDWIRGEEAPAAPARGGRDDARGARGRDDQGGRGERSDRGPRPDRGDRPFRSERPDRGDRPARGDRPPREERGEGRERSFSDRPRGKPSFSKGPGADRPPREGGERSFGRPQADRTEGRGRPSGSRPSGDRPYGDRPTGDRPERGDREGGRGGFGGRPGGKSFGGKPSGDRAFGERSGERSGGERAGGKNFGGKPAGKSFGKPAGGFGGKPGGAGKPGGRPAGGSGKPGGRPAGNRSSSGPRSGGGNKGPRGPRG